MDEHDHSSLSIVAAVLMVAGWLGLILLVNFALPTLGPRWFFYLMWVMALTGTALPFVRFLNRRFSPERPSPAGVLVRQAIWVGIFGATLAWLQLSRALSPLIAVLVAAALAAVEWFVRLRERSRWNPEE